MPVHKPWEGDDKIDHTEDDQFSEDVNSIDAAYNKSDNDDKNQRKEVSDNHLADKLLSVGLVAAIRQIIFDAKHERIAG